MFNVKRVDGIKLAGVGARRVQAYAVNQYHQWTTAHVHTVVGAALAADIKAGNQLGQRVFEFFAALNLLLQLGVFDNPGGLRHLRHRTVATVGGDHHVFVIGRLRYGGCHHGEK